MQYMTLNGKYLIVGSKTDNYYGVVYAGKTAYYKGKRTSSFARRLFCSTNHDNDDVAHFQAEKVGFAYTTGRGNNTFLASSNTATNL